MIKYLQKKYGDHHIVSRNSWLGTYLIELLDKKYRKTGTIKDGNFYQIIVPKNIIKEVGFDMAPIKYNKMEQMVEKLFRSDLYSYIEVTIENELLVQVCKSYFKQNGDLLLHKQDVMKAIRQFLKSYNITEEDLKLESMYRDYGRHMKRIRTRVLNQRLNQLIA